MSIKIYNSVSRKKEEFKPLKKSKVGMYVCGPTVYDEPHIGHLRSAYIFDVIRRYLEYRKYKVKFVRNVTDVDDKIINKAKEEFKGEDLNSAAKKVAEKYLKSYHECMVKLGIQAPDREPKATEYINKMIKCIAGLIKKGAAYAAEGDVYFGITKAKNYGKLSHQSLDMMESGVRVAAGENKRNPLDFALWKKAKPDEPSWDSPWGKGRPGWHMECSVMSSDILGSQFDIHGGGIDLIFPHHENEIAQSECAGKKFAKYWIHHGLLTINSQKMAKSLGNFITLKEIEQRGYPFDTLKLLFLQAHYSHPIDFSWQKMEEMKKAYERIAILLEKVDRQVASLPSHHVTSKKYKEAEDLKKSFLEAMDDNFNTPHALAVLFDLVSDCNKLLENQENNRLAALAYGVDMIKQIGNIFGLVFIFLSVSSGEMSAKVIEEQIRLRLEYRREKKFKEADKIRKDLEVKGIILEDTKEETVWRRKM